MTYREIRDILNGAIDSQLDHPARVIEMEVVEDDGPIELGAEFPIKGMGTDETGQPYFEMPRLPE